MTKRKKKEKRAIVNGWTRKHLREEAKLFQKSMGIILYELIRCLVKYNILDPEVQKRLFGVTLEEDERFQQIKEESSKTKKGGIVVDDYTHELFNRMKKELRKSITDIAFELMYLHVTYRILDPEVKDRLWGAEEEKEKEEKEDSRTPRVDRTSKATRKKDIAKRVKIQDADCLNLWDINSSLYCLGFGKKKRLSDTDNEELVRAICRNCRKRNPYPKNEEIDQPPPPPDELVKLEDLGPSLDMLMAIKHWDMEMTPEEKYWVECQMRENKKRWGKADPVLYKYLNLKISCWKDDRNKMYYHPQGFTYDPNRPRTVFEPELSGETRMKIKWRMAYVESLYNDAMKKYLAEPWMKHWSVKDGKSVDFTWGPLDHSYGGLRKAGKGILTNKRWWWRVKVGKKWSIIPEELRTDEHGKPYVGCLFREWTLPPDQSIF